MLAPHAAHAEEDDHDRDHAAPTDAPLVMNGAASVPHFTMASGGAAVSFGAVASSGGAAPSPAPIVDASALVEPAKRISGAEPVYPESAKAAGVEADVLVELIVDERGDVESARVVRHAGYGLDEAAIVAARRWRFSPRTVNGRPARVRLSWPVVFELTN
jgi:TonB family protein